MDWKTLSLVILLVLSVNAFKLQKHSSTEEEIPDDELYLAENGNEFEGDIVLPKDENFRNIIQHDTSRWPNGVVPYSIGSEYSYNDKQKILAAMNEISSKTCIKFVQRTNQNGYVQINRRSGCSCYVGYTGRMQQMSLGQWCLGKGTVMHEFLHAIGLWHEQSRPDRDNYVDIYWNNMHQGMRYNFDKKSNSRTLGFKYDYSSLMHYGKNSFSSNGQATILPKDRNQQIGQRNVMSSTDIAKINKLYNCQGGTSTGTDTGGGVVTNCTDNNSSCSDWAKYGECQRNPGYMLVNCKKSCNKC